MARTTAMRLIELMIFRQDIRKVLKYLGEMGDFQFQQDFDASSDTKAANPAQDVFDSLQQARTNLGIEDLTSFKGALCLPADDDGEKADKIVTTVAKIHQDELDAAEEEKRASAEYKEALAFSFFVLYGESSLFTRLSVSLSISACNASISAEILFSPSKLLLSNASCLCFSKSAIASVSLSISLESELFSIACANISLSHSLCSATVSS